MDGKVAIRGGGRTEIVGDRQERLEGAWSKVLQVAYRRQQIREFRSKRAWLGRGSSSQQQRRGGFRDTPCPYCPGSQAVPL